MTEPAPMQQCSQCGRTGTRQFRTLDGAFGGPSMTFCTNTRACRRRWPKPTRDED